MFSSSTFTSDPGIICFHHCTTKVFCFHIPDSCPTCKTPLPDDDENLRFMPFRLPYPFVRASQYPCAIVLRPTIGDFLNGYDNSTDLHIGVTTSHCTVVEFDRNGLQSTSSKLASKTWSQCLHLGDVPEAWHDLWDSVLMQVCEQPNWSAEHYNEDSYNCYTFVLTFLQALGYGKLSQAAQSKTGFCEKYIIPRSTAAAKYISLYRILRDNGLFIVQHTKDNANNSIEANGSRSSSSSSSSRVGSNLCTIEE